MANDFAAKPFPVDLSWALNHSAGTMKVLVVEDEMEIASVIRQGLESHGFVVELAHTGEDGLRAAREWNPNIVVLDGMLPDIDGLGVLRHLRDGDHPVPVIMLTARNTLEDRLTGLDAGADDYLAKPFFMEELVARLRALLRRQTETPFHAIQAGGLTLNKITRECSVGTNRIELTTREFRLLELLLRTPGNVYTRSEILESVWEYRPGSAETNIIDVYVRRLRTKLTDAGAPANVIETVRGVGYRIGGPESPAL